MRPDNRITLLNKFIFMLMLLLPLGQVVAQNTEYQAGIHYLEIANPVKVNAKQGQSGEILVFFKYTCPACYQLHPFIEAWESTLDTSVVVKRVPVFQPEAYSKAYYAADLLTKERQLPYMDVGRSRSTGGRVNDQDSVGLMLFLLNVLIPTSVIWVQAHILTGITPTPHQ